MILSILGIMEKLRLFFRKIKETYDLLSAKKYTTIAGTLVFFLIMSIMPMTFWVSLLFGKIPIDNQRIFALPVFDEVKEVLLYVQKEAANATQGASIVLLLTTLYSSTNLFYQMRRTGELIYDFRLKRVGVKTRLAALVLLFLVILLSAIILAFFAALSFLFSRILSSAAEMAMDYILLAVAAFLLILLFNAYLCPYKVPLHTFFRGALFTVAAWGVALFGFALYLRFSNVTRLYGALSTLIVFLLWLYLLTIGFVVGVVLNSRRVVGKERLYNF